MEWGRERSVGMGVEVVGERRRIERKGMRRSGMEFMGSMDAARRGVKGWRWTRCLAVRSGGRRCICILYCICDDCYCILYAYSEMSSRTSDSTFSRATTMLACESTSVYAGIFKIK